MEFTLSYGYDMVYQEDKPSLVITKTIIEDGRSYKCIFDMHTGCRAGFVRVFDKENMIISGNYLWRNPSCKNAEDYFYSISILDSLADIRNNYTL